MLIVIINLLILAAFAGLFFISRKTEIKTERKSRIEIVFHRAAAYLNKFLSPVAEHDLIRRQKLLHPTGKATELVKEYRIRKISEFLIILFAGNILSMVMFLNIDNSGEKKIESRIERNDYGEGTKSETFDISVDGEKLKGSSTVEISERRYSNEELIKVFEKIKKELPSVIYSEGDSSEKTENNLNLPSKYEDYPIEISWYSSDYNVMDSYGVIAGDFFEKDGKRIELTASLDYYGEHDEISIPINVFPRKRTAEEYIRTAIERAIRENDMKEISSDSLQLPEKVEGKNISYSYPGTNSAVMVFFISIMAAVGIYFMRDDELKKAVEKRDLVMSEDYPEIVSRLTLLLSAGMTIKGAFEKTAFDYEKDKLKGKVKERYAYEEMLVTVRQMRSGKSEMAAYQEFGSRSASPRFNKLGSLLSQNLKKGSSGILNILEYEMKDAFEDRKAIARRKGEEAGTKLLLPMGMMLAIVLIVVVVPSMITFA